MLIILISYLMVRCFFFFFLSSSSNVFQTFNSSLWCNKTKQKQKKNCFTIVKFTKKEKTEVKKKCSKIICGIAHITPITK